MERVQARRRRRLEWRLLRQPRTAPPQARAFLRMQAGLALCLCMVGIGACREERLPPAPSARILVEAEGPTQVDARMLEDAGLHWDGLEDGSFRLFSEGRPQPLWVGEDPASGELALRFYAASTRGLETGKRAYLLTSAEVPRWIDETDDAMPEVAAVSRTGEAAVADAATAADGDASDARDGPPGPLPPADSGLVLATLRHETDARYLPQRLDGDPWLGEMLSAPGELALGVDLEGLAEGPARLRLGLWSATSSPLAIDHRLVAAVEGRVIGEAEWDGAGSRDLFFDVPSGLLKETGTRVTLSLPGIEGIAADVVHLDWLELDYPRRPRLPEERALTFVAAGGPTRFEAEAGTLTLFDGSGIALERALDLEGEGLTLDGLDRGLRYTLAGPGAWRPPALVRRAGDGRDLRRGGPGARWLAIGPEDLLEPMAALAARREAEGLPSALIDAEAIYDQFGHGQQSAEAIRRFLAYAVENWRPAPRYVVLVGDASTDPRGLLGDADAHRMPTLYVPTEFGGMTAGDPLIGQVDDDPWPDLALGRIPARSAEQVEVFVRKTLAMDASGGESSETMLGQDAPEDAEPPMDPDPPRSWQRRALAVADGREGIFQQDAQRFLDRLPESYSTELVAPEPGDLGLAETLVERFDAGAGLVAYFGHGTVSQWGQDRIFTRDDVPSLRNAGRLPIVLHMTCLAGLFTHPEAESLSEALLFHPEGGAAAMLAPTSLTLGNEQGLLSDAFADALADPALPRLGDAVLHAWRSVPMDRPSSRDVVQTFVILGDPALPLAREGNAEGDG